MYAEDYEDTGGGEVVRRPFSPSPDSGREETAHPFAAAAVLPWGAWAVTEATNHKHHEPPLLHAGRAMDGHCS